VPKTAYKWKISVHMCTVEQFLSRKNKGTKLSWNCSKDGLVSKAAYVWKKIRKKIFQLPFVEVQIHGEDLVLGSSNLQKFNLLFIFQKCFRSSLK